ncbi:DoxX family protein [Nocardia sp. NPDC049220]|uniref:DoxX family protein n=1 Tax=Nocardia sp. NPDC049220 TaxID=3155273 RepID=UPI0033D69D56
MTTKSLSEHATNDKLDDISTDIGLLLLRVVFGGLLAAHGSQKLFGWFDGPGWRANADGFHEMGYNPGKLFGTIAGLSECTGGVLLLLGLLTPLASAIVIGTMINAINASWSGGLLTGKGYESALLFAVAAAAIAFTGPGKFSLDAGNPWQRQGFVWGVGAIVLAVVAGLLALILKWVF